MTKQFSNYSDLLTFTRASKGHALRPVSYGAELVTNGTFSTDSDWTKGTGWTISNGVADLDGSQGGNSDLSQSLTLKANAIYQLSVEVTAVTTALQYVTITNTGGAELDSLSTTGTYTAIFVAPSTSENLNIRGTSSSVSTIDNVSVKEVLFDQPDGTLTLFEHPDNVPRVEWDADRNRLGLLVEESRTNLVTYSDVDTTNWTGGAFANISTESVSNPFGFSSVVKVVPTTDTAGGAPKRTVQKSINVTTGTTYTYSAFVKAAGYNAAYIIFTDRPNVYGGVAYDLSTASLIELDGGNQGTLSNPFIEDFGDGWYRIGFSHDGDGGKDASNGVAVGFVPTGLTKTVNYGQSSFAGDGISGGYVAGVQVEAGSFPTSYIKTTGSTATRSADVASIPVADFGYNQSAGSMVVQASTNAPLGSRANDGVFSLEKNSNNLHRVYLSANDALNWQMRQGGSTVFATAIINNFPAEQEFKISLSWHSGSQDASYDGNAATNFGTATTMADTAVDLKIGYINTSNMLNGYIKSIKYYPRRLTNAQLQDLTS